MTSSTPSKAFTIAARAIRGLVTVEYTVAGLLFVLAMLALTTEITLRYGFDSGFPESAEVIVITFIYVYLLGAAALYGRNEDIAIDFVYRMLPDAFRSWFMLVVHLAIAITMGIVLIYTLDLIKIQGQLLTLVTQLPMEIWWWSLVIASASIVLTSCVEVWACLIWITSGSRPNIWPEDRGEDLLITKNHKKT